jgi:5-methylcytosine-specific restriction endonuclease McrA
MNYDDYINSGRWRNSPARLAELEASGFRCRICNGDGEGSAVEIHHRTYARLGNEQSSDLTALCSGCHRVVTDHLRRARFARHAPRHANIRVALDVPAPLFDPTVKREPT